MELPWYGVVLVTMRSDSRAADVTGLCSAVTILLSSARCAGEPGGAYSAVEYASPTSEDNAQVRPLFYAMWCVSTFTARNAVVKKVGITSSNPAVKVRSCCAV
jgi:hypothetical protein